MSAAPDQEGLAAPAPRAGASGRRGGGGARLVATAQRCLLPARRLLSRAVLVYEERHFREVAIAGTYAALAAEAKKLRDEARSLEERIILRADIVMEELWRRTEGLGARQATELQRLTGRLDDLQHAVERHAPELARLSAQMAEVHRLASEMAEIRRQARDSGALAAGSGPLRAEIERGLGPPPAQRFEGYLKYFENQAPVLDLCPGNETFGTLAGAAGIEARRLDGAGDPGAAAGLAGMLDGLAPGSFGGAFCGDLLDRLPDDAAAAVLTALRPTLQPSGVAVVEAANPASFACYLAALGRPGERVLRSPEELAALATSAGFEVDECRYANPPARHLGGVSQDLTDPALAEVAEGINALVGQLNDLLYGPLDYALVLRPTAAPAA
jgi:hypothetical protein